MNFTGVLKTGVFKHIVAMVTITEKNTKMSNFYNVSIIEPHGRGVPEAILNGRSPRPDLPECGRSPHEGRSGRDERPLSLAEGTPSREVLFLLYPPITLYSIMNTLKLSRLSGANDQNFAPVNAAGRTMLKV